jgi:two-component system chemotaxis response regulator CheY
MKLLIIDDAPEMLRAFRDILEAYGCEVCVAENGEEGLARYAEVMPDVVLMDILMPKLDGISATKKMLELDPSAKIIIISAVGKSGLDNECLLAGARKFIIKPFKIKELLSSINSLAAK